MLQRCLSVAWFSALMYRTESPTTSLAYSKQICEHRISLYHKTGLGLPECRERHKPVQPVQLIILNSRPETGYVGCKGIQERPEKYKTSPAHFCQGPSIIDNLHKEGSAPETWALTQPRLTGMWPGCWTLVLSILTPKQKIGPSCHILFTQHSSRFQTQVEFSCILLHVPL